MAFLPQIGVAIPIYEEGRLYVNLLCTGPDRSTWFSTGYGEGSASCQHGKKITAFQKRRYLRLALKPGVYCLVAVPSGLTTTPELDFVKKLEK